MAEARQGPGGAAFVLLPVIPLSILRKSGADSEWGLPSCLDKFSMTAWEGGILSGIARNLIGQADFHVVNIVPAGLKKRLGRNGKGGY